jgi:hypothetical protein
MSGVLVAIHGGQKNPLEIYVKKGYLSPSMESPMPLPLLETEDGGVWMDAG